MKKIIIIFTLTSVITSFLACNTDDILSPENRNSLSAENFWKNERDAEAGIYSVYSALQFPGVLGSDGITPLTMNTEASRIGNVGGNVNSVQFADGLVLSTNQRVLDMWRDLYQIVFRANQVLDNVPQIEMDETVKKEILGEAYFLRGLAMFWVADTYNKGEVPYPLSSPDKLEDARYGLETREFVYNQIFDDLLKAQTNLTDRLSWSSEKQQGRATWGAVTSILGKVYLYEENLTRAKEEFLKVIESGEYSLTPNIRDNFTEAGEFNTESIFEVQFFANLIDDDGNFGSGEGSQPDESSLRQVAWTRGEGGFGGVFTTHFISSLYRNDVINPNLPINNDEVLFYGKGFNSGDSPEEQSEFIETFPRTISHRSEASIAYEGDGTLFYEKTTTETSFIRVFSRAQIKKFMDWETAGAPRSSGINERVIRLADVYLMYAETILREQGDAAVMEALTYINMVRERSGLVTLEKLFEGVGAPPIFRNTFQLRFADVSDTQIEEFVTNVISERYLVADNKAEDSLLVLSVLPDLAAGYNGIENDDPQTQRDLRADYFKNLDPDYFTIDPSLLILPQSLTATNIIRHLFDKERPAEFAWEGRGINWGDLRRRPKELIDGGAERIKQLGAVSYVPLTLGILPFEFDDRETSLQDFRIAKASFNEDDFFLPIPSEELIQNPLLGK